jgi:cobalt-zinc-cadmium efflux system membrane fusion protein
MVPNNILRSPWVRLILVVIIIGGILGAMAIPPFRERVQAFFNGKNEGESAENNQQREGAELVEVNGNQGLRLSADAMAGFDINPVEVVAATNDRALPPQSGTVNYDNERLFQIRSRFPGEVAEIAPVLDADSSITPTRQRPLRFGDKVKQGDLLAVIWSQQLGTAKAALIDTYSALQKSQTDLKNYEGLMEKGAGALNSFLAVKRQVETDKNAYRTAERSLRMWKLTDKEIEDIKEEAKSIRDQKKVLSPEEELKWARVELRVPNYEKTNPNRELIVVEKNTNLNDMVDPINSTPLFKLADTSRLAIWVFPPEEYLPIIQEGLKKNGSGRLQWDIRFQSDAPNAPPRKLDIIQISPSLDPTQHTTMVLGHLPNPDGKYRVGQFLTATIYVPPDENTVEIPTQALNEQEGQAFVFVRNDKAKDEFILRRVAVVHRFKEKTFVRSKLTEEDMKMSAAEVARGRRPLQPLLAGESVITRGVVELTAALEDLATKEKVARKRSELAKATEKKGV